MKLFKKKKEPEFPVPLDYYFLMLKYVWLPELINKKKRFFNWLAEWADKQT